MTHSRRQGTCPTCKRPRVTLMSKQPDAQCSVCTRVGGVATKILNNQPINDSDRATIRRVTGQHSADSIEARIAAKQGFIPLFQRLSTAEPAAEWPRVATGWECSDGSFHRIEAIALRTELALARGTARPERRAA